MSDIVSTFETCIKSDCVNCPRHYRDGRPTCEDFEDYYIEMPEKLLYDVLAAMKEHEQKTGHWIDSAGNDVCSECGASYSDLYPDYSKTHYCPNCGAKMTSH